MDRKLRIGLVAVALLLAAAVGAEVYRWVDAEGTTHYGNTPPPGTSARAVPIAPAPLEAASAASRPGVVEQARRLAAERERAEAAQAEQQDRERRNAQAHVRACAFAREQLATVQRGGPVMRLERDGARTYLPDDQRDAEIARLQGDVARSCAGLDPADVQPALHDREQRAERDLECLRARDRLAALQAPGSRAVGSDLDATRARARFFCD